MTITESDVFPITIITGASVTDTLNEILATQQTIVERLNTMATQFDGLIAEVHAIHDTDESLKKVFADITARLKATEGQDPATVAATVAQITADLEADRSALVAATLNTQGAQPPSVGTAAGSASPGTAGEVAVDPAQAPGGESIAAAEA